MAWRRLIERFLLRVRMSLCNMDEKENAHFDVDVSKLNQNEQSTNTPGEQVRISTYSTLADSEA